MYIKLIIIVIFCLTFFALFYAINKNIRGALISLLVFLLGFNVAYNEIIPQSYVLGTVSNYRMFQIHIVDLIMVISVFGGIISLLKQNKQFLFTKISERIPFFKNQFKFGKFLLLLKNNYLIVLVVFSILLQLLMSIFFHNDVVSIMWSARFLLYFVAVLVFKKYFYNSIDDRKTIVIKSVFTGIFPIIGINLIVACFQVILSRSLGLTMLGESPIDKYSTGIALLRISDIYILRGYGFFAHPNILGAFAFFSLLLADVFNSKLLNNVNHRLINIFRLMCFGVILVSFSKIIIFIALLYLIVRMFKINPKIQIYISFLVIVSIYLLPLLYKKIEIQSFELRGLQLSTAFNYLLSSFPQSLLGKGYMGWLLVTAKDPILLPTGAYFLQPLHNTFLLMLIEWGIFSIPFILLIFQKGLWQIKHSGNLGVVFLFCLGMFDHYFITIPIGILIMLVIILGSERSK